MDHTEQIKIEKQHRMDRILFDGLAGDQRAELIEQATKTVCRATAAAWRERLSRDPNDPPRNLVGAVAGLYRKRHPRPWVA